MSKTSSYIVEQVEKHIRKSKIQQEFNIHYKTDTTLKKSKTETEKMLTDVPGLMARYKKELGDFQTSQKKMLHAMLLLLNGRQNTA